MYKSSTGSTVNHKGLSLDSYGVNLFLFIHKMYILKHSLKSHYQGDSYEHKTRFIKEKTSEDIPEESCFIHGCLNSFDGI